MNEVSLQPLAWLVSVQMLLYAIGWLLCTTLLREERRAVAHWGGFMFLMSAAFLLIGMRGEPRTWLAYTGANILVIAGYLLARRGFELFMREPTADGEHLAVFSFTTLCFLALGPAAEHAHWRVILAYGASALVVGHGIARMTPAVRAEYGVQASLIIAVPPILVVLLGLLRVVQQIHDPGRQLELHLTRLNNTQMILAYLIGTAIFNFAYMTMVMVRLTRKLQALSEQDSLTGLPNRRVVSARLTQEWLRWSRHRTPTCILAIDLDHFKRINDSYGHPAGDELLIEVGKRLQAGVRQVDTVARTGGEEFLVLLPDTALAAAHAVAERLRESIATEPFVLGAETVKISASLGVAQADENDPDADALLGRADRALYDAKTRGRNRTCLAAPDLPDDAPSPTDTSPALAPTRPVARAVAEHA